MNFNTSKREGNLEIELTPLINIVFLMLIFFMLAGTLKSSDNIQAAQMESPEIVEESTLVVSVDKNGTLGIAGETIERESLGKRLRLHKQSAGKVSIKPDARLAAEQLLSLSELLKESGFTQMTLIVDSP